MWIIHLPWWLWCAWCLFCCCCSVGSIESGKIGWFGGRSWPLLDVGNGQACGIEICSSSDSSSLFSSKSVRGSLFRTSKVSSNELLLWLLLFFCRVASWCCCCCCCSLRLAQVVNTWTARSANKIVTCFMLTINVSLFLYLFGITLANSW